MGSGFPISAAAGRLQVMDAWPISSGEALHTSTYLGHPVGCAAAVATIDEIERLQLPERARRLGSELGSRLRELSSRGIVEVRGRGFLWGIAFHDAELAAAVVKRALRAGAIFLQSGIRGEVIAISPPLVMGEEQLARALEILKVAIEETA
jgi:4-aminobutyrate aminotransferase-like enzyme